jgi:hypothetical protein
MLVLPFSDLLLQAPLVTLFALSISALGRPILLTPTLERPLARPSRSRCRLRTSILSGIDFLTCAITEAEICRSGVDVYDRSETPDRLEDRESYAELSSVV